MSVDRPNPDGARSEPAQVRVELLGETSEEMHFVGLDDNDGRQAKSVATLLASLGLLGLVITGMWWVGQSAPPEEAESEIDRPAQVPPTTAPVDPISELALVGSGDLGARWLDLPSPTTPTHIVRHRSSYVASRPDSLELLDSTDGVTWRAVSSGLPGPNDGERAGVVALFQRGLEYFAFVVTSEGQTSSAELSIYASPEPFDQWSRRSTYLLEGHPRDISFDGEHFSAVVDNLAQGLFVPQMGTRLIRGSIGSGEIGNTQVAPNQFVSSHVPTSDGGVLATLTSFSITQATDAVRTVSKWTEASGWSDVLPDGWAQQPTARLIKTSAGIYLWDTGTLLPVDTDVSGEPEQTPRIQLDTALPWVGDPFTSLSATRTPDAFMAISPQANGGLNISISRDFDSWSRLRLPAGTVLPELLVYDGAIAILRVVSNAEPRLIVVPFTQPTASTASRAFDVIDREVADGEWAQPVVSAAPPGTPGFIGLSNANGVVSFYSADGVSPSVTYQTDLPFGYFINEMSVFDDGLSVKGKLGLIDDSIFTSQDGIAWSPLSVELPRGAGVIEIDSYDQAQGRVVIAGSLGWADDLSRTERAVLYYNGAEWIDVDPRPCTETTEPCTILSVRFVGVEEDLDVVMAQHQLDNRIAWSFWQNDEWAISVSTDQPVSEPIGLQRVGDELFALNEEVARIEYALQRTTSVAGPAPGIPGRYVALSPAGDAAVYIEEDQDRLWTVRIGGDGRWDWYQQTFGYQLDGFDIDRVIAVNSEYALASAIGPEGSGHPAV